MKAAVLTESGRVSVEEIPAPAADGWALVAAKAAGCAARSSTSWTG